MENIIPRIVEILKANEEALSDGYGYYYGTNRVDEVLEGIAREIASLLTQREPDACPECGEEYSGACGSCAVGHERG